METEQIQQADFIKAFRNCFFNDDMIHKFIKNTKLYLDVNLARPQAVKLLELLWNDKKIRNKKHFAELSDEDVVKWLVDFVKEHKGVE